MNCKNASVYRSPNVDISSGNDPLASEVK